MSLFKHLFGLDSSLTVAGWSFVAFLALAELPTSFGIATKLLDYCSTGSIADNSHSKLDLDPFLLLSTILLDCSRLAIAGNIELHFGCNSLIHQCRLEFHSIVGNRLRNQLQYIEPMLITQFIVVTVADTGEQHSHKRLSLLRLNHMQTESVVELYLGSFVEHCFLMAWQSCFDSSYH